MAKKLNLRPRKKLGFSNPKTEFFKQIANFALASWTCGKIFAKQNADFYLQLAKNFVILRHDGQKATFADMYVLRVVNTFIYCHTVFQFISVSYEAPAFLKHFRMRRRPYGWWREQVCIAFHTNLFWTHRVHGSPWYALVVPFGFGCPESTLTYWCVTGGRASGKRNKLY